MTRKLIIALVVVCLGWTAFAAVLLWPDAGDRDSSADTLTSSETAAGGSGPDPEASGLDPEGPSGEGGDSSSALSDAGAARIASGGATAPSVVATALPVPGGGPFAVQEAAAPLAVRPRLKGPPSSGLLFDVDSGRVLWARRPAAERPIASLTKMMTALIIAERHRPSEQVMIGAKAPRVEGSRIGVLKSGRRFPLGGLFLGLLLVSGNDAAVALAEHDSGSMGAFITRMNARASELELGCSHFAGPAGLQDTGNRSCAYDLAALARADLANEWVASVTSRRSASVAFPIKGGSLELANNHYFAQRGIGIPGAEVTGLKTGFTNGAGRCYVTTARLGATHLGVIVLDSPDPIRQVPELFRAGFIAEGALAPKPKKPRGGS
ncbi:MAG: hypothetical protein M3M99_02490 [Actinomycetota bacterium]|nr:hypothetical protein [Actinomycetota bacterium]